jgi:hypothetical protein
MNKYNELQKHLNGAKKIEVQLLKKYKNSEDKILLEKMANYNANLISIKNLNS